MARINRIPLEELTEFEGTSVTIDYGGNDSQLSGSSGHSKNALWVVRNCFFLKLFRIRKWRRDGLAYQQLVKLDDRLLEDIGVTFELQTPGDHRLRRVSRYTVAQPAQMISGDVNKAQTITVQWRDYAVVNFLRSVLKDLPIKIYRFTKATLVDREACRQLLRLDDDHLKDMGVSRNDVIWASHQKNATRSLQALAEARRKTHGRGDVYENRTR